MTNNNKVTVICYGLKETWESREEAMAYYLEGAMNCEGSEAERYMNIYTKLQLGYDVCDDSELDEDEIETVEEAAETPATSAPTKTYKHVTKGTIATLVSVDGDVYTLEDNETKERKTVNAITLRRWWKETEAPAPVEPAPAEDKPVTPSEPMKMSETITALETLFDKLNVIYFEDKLPRPVITVQSTPKAYGHCTTKQIWQSDDSAMYEINIGAEFINRPMDQTAATLCHEMVHLYCLVNGIQDTCQKGRYHNKTFKNEAEARDLHIDYDRAIGYSITSPTEAFTEKLKASGFDMTIRFARITPTKKASSEREKPHKYVCPVCGQKVSSTADLHLICGICKVEMVRED
jgi:hypothetical protein